MSEKTEYFNSYPFKTKYLKDKFYKGLNDIALNHKEFFDNCPEYITNVESFLIIKEPVVNGIIYDFNYQSLLSEDLKVDILNFLNSYGSLSLEE